MVGDLLLCSGGYLTKYTDRIRIFLENHNISEILIDLHALPTEEMREQFFVQLLEKNYDKKYGVNFTTIHRSKDKQKAIHDAECIFVFGGNTFSLIDSLYGEDLFHQIKEKVFSGTPYIGLSAGSNIAGKTIQTTNDMPIIMPPKFDALGFVQFNLNPHYIDAHDKEVHGGESREERIREFHLIKGNDQPVVGIYEGSILCVNDGIVTIDGSKGGVFIAKGKKLKVLIDGEEINSLL
jgi:dipeptidase E